MDFEKKTQYSAALNYKQRIHVESSAHASKRWLEIQKEKRIH